MGEHCPMVTHLRIKPEDHIDAGTRRNREVTRVRNLTRLIQGSSTTIRSCQDLPLLHPKQRDTHLAYASPFYNAKDANPLDLPSTPHLHMSRISRLPFPLFVQVTVTEYPGRITERAGKMVERIPTSCIGIMIISPSCRKRGK